jgi:hypothetical protein
MSHRSGQFALQLIEGNAAFSIRGRAAQHQALTEFQDVSSRSYQPQSQN